jgi:hypothetical protein
MAKRSWRGLVGGALSSVLVALSGCSGTKHGSDDGPSVESGGSSGGAGREGAGVGGSGGASGSAGVGSGATDGGSAGGGGAAGSSAGRGGTSPGGGSSTGGAGAGEGGEGASAGGGLGGTAGTGGAAGGAGSGGECERTFLIMADTSGSMDMGVNGQAESKWEVLWSVLLDLVVQLPEATHVGMLTYPNMPSLGIDPPECFDPSRFVPIAPNDANQQDAMATFVRAAFPEGGAATHRAYQHALSLLQSEAPGREQLVVLITDGAPTYSAECIGSGSSDEPADVAPLLAKVAQARSNGIRTLSVGWFEAEVDHPWLSTLAVEGGTAADDCVTDRCHVVAGESGAYAALERILAYATCTD